MYDNFSSEPYSRKRESRRDQVPGDLAAFFTTDVAADGSLGTGRSTVSVPVRYEDASAKDRAKIKRLCKDLDEEFLRLMRFDAVSLFSLTSFHQAKSIATELRSLPGVTCEGTTIVDGTAGGGGNTFAFARFFKSVISIEIDAPRCEQLLHNASVVRDALRRRASRKPSGPDPGDVFVGTIAVYNGDVFEVVQALSKRTLANNRRNVVFVDPPWGGTHYDRFEAIELRLSNDPLWKVIDRFKNESGFAYVAVKLPLNANLKDVDARCGRPVLICRLGKIKLHVY